MCILFNFVPPKIRDGQLGLWSVKIEIVSLAFVKFVLATGHLNVYLQQIWR